MAKIILIVPVDQTSSEVLERQSSGRTMLPWIGAAKKDIIDVEDFPKWWHEFQNDPTASRFYVEKIQ